MRIAQPVSWTSELARAKWDGTSTLRLFQHPLDFLQGSLVFFSLSKFLELLISYILNKLQNILRFFLDNFKIPLSFSKPTNLSQISVSDIMILSLGAISFFRARWNTDGQLNIFDPLSFYCLTGKTLIYDILNNRWCENIGRPHKSNHIM